MKYIHNRTGSMYTLIAISNDHDTERFPKTAVYKSELTGAIFSRPYSEFCEKFTPKHNTEIDGEISVLGLDKEG